MSPPHPHLASLFVDDLPSVAISRLGRGGEDRPRRHPGSGSSRWRHGGVHRRPPRLSQRGLVAIRHLSLRQAGTASLAARRPSLLSALSRRRGLRYRCKSDPGPRIARLRARAGFLPRRPGFIRGPIGFWIVGSGWRLLFGGRSLLIGCGFCGGLLGGRWNGEADVVSLLFGGFRFRRVAPSLISALSSGR